MAREDNTLGISNKNNKLNYPNERKLLMTDFAKATIRRKNN